MHTRVHAPGGMNMNRHMSMHTRHTCTHTQDTACTALCTAHLGEDDVPDARPLRRDGLLLDPADGQHAPREAELAWRCTR